MSKKILILFLFLSQTLDQVQGQKLMHSLGGTVSLITGKVNNPNETYKFSMQQTTFTYFPRYNFFETKKYSISIGAPIGVGIGVASNDFDSDFGIAFAYDLPIVLDFNMGGKSTMDNKKKFGGFFGTGFGYSRVNISKSEFSDFTGSSLGPIIRAGVRFGSNRESWGDKSITLGFNYKKGIDKQKLSTFGANVLLDF